MANVYLGLVHSPVYNKNMKTVTSSVTNFDIHDIARTCNTYAIKNYFIIHPSENQQEIVNDILNYWNHGYGKECNPDRNQALSIVKLVSDIAACLSNIQAETGQKPIVMTTDARSYSNTISYKVARETFIAQEQPILLLFGTGWGIQDSVMEAFDYILEPIYGVGEYNHLCVRSAVAIILERLLVINWWEK